MFLVSDYFGLIFLDIFPFDYKCHKLWVSFRIFMSIRTNECLMYQQTGKPPRNISLSSVKYLSIIMTPYGFMITSMFMLCNTIFSRHVTRVNKHNVSDVTTFGPDAGIGAIKSFDVIASNDTFIMPSKFITYMYRKGVNISLMYCYYSAP